MCNINPTLAAALTALTLGAVAIVLLVIYFRNRDK
jgi:hypothetical protein